MTLDRTISWIHSIVETNNLKQDLLSGKSSYNHVHVLAIFSIVSGPRVTAATLPETLLLDKYRLERMQQEFSYLVSAAAVLATSASLSETKQENYKVFFNFLCRQLRLSYIDSL
jgi:T-complex protein 11